MQTTPQNLEANNRTNVTEAAKNAVKNGLSDVVTEEGAEKGQQEGTVTKMIESATTKIPSGVFLTSALAAIGGSALLQLIGRKENAQFVAHWVPTILILGLYNKLVKLHGSES